MKGPQKASRKASRKARASAGFTLLEIVVALAVFGLLLVGLSQTVRFGLAAWRQDARISDGKTDMEAVDRSLRAIIENLSPGDESGQPSITGAANSLTGTTRLRVPGSGLTAIRIEAGLAVSGNRLVLRWRPYHHWQPFTPPPRPQETELIGGVARLVIEYWLPSGTWASSWEQPDLPLLIRLHLTFAGDNPPHWPDIIAAPRLSRP
jgi:general secretion pathway protein J